MRRRRSSDGMATVPEASDLSTNNGDSSSDNGAAFCSSPDVHRFATRRRHLVQLCYLHFAAVATVVATGMWSNGGRKYISVDASRLPAYLERSLASAAINNAKSLNEKFMAAVAGEGCGKAYVNVYSSSFHEEHAIICCTASGAISSFRPHSAKFSDGRESYPSNLCSPRLPLLNLPTSSLPFSKRLTRMPDAWILPLLPILLRLTFQTLAWIIQRICNGSKAMTNNSAPKVNPYQLSKHHSKDAPLQTKFRKENSSLSYRQLSSSSSTLSHGNSSTTSLENIVIAQNSQQSPPLSPSFLSFQDTTPSPPNTQIKTTLQRLFFYIIVLNFRGWGLYVGANAIEDYLLLPFLTGNNQVVTSPPHTNTMSDIEYDKNHINSDGITNNSCWYQPILKQHHQSSMHNNSQKALCYGQPFDFSDHMVLFLAHYLPLFVMEMVVCYLFPFWRSFFEDSGGAETTLMTMSSAWMSTQTHIDKKNILTSFLKSMLNWSMTMLHLLFFIYLHVLVMHATYQTAAYFHTPSEIMVGYVISLFIQIPVWHLVLYDDKWIKLRKFVGLPVTFYGDDGSSSGGCLGEKGD